MAKCTTQRVAETTAVTLLLSMAVVVWVVPLMSCGCEKAKQSQRLSSIKQLALGVMVYAQDHDERLPGWVTLPDGRAAHNVWDQQIRPGIKSKDVFLSAAATGIRSYSDPDRRRVVSFGLNGLLITEGAGSNGGRADFRRPPAEPRSMQGVAHPSETILFAELAVDRPMAGRFGRSPEPEPNAFGPVAPKAGEAWQEALDGWIDISPGEFVENTPAPGCYDANRWDGTNGVARDLYQGGGTYAFLDGHVKFMPIEETVSGGGKVGWERYWSPDNRYNMWNPDR